MFSIKHSDLKDVLPHSLLLSPSTQLELSLSTQLENYNINIYTKPSVNNIDSMGARMCACNTETLLLYKFSVLHTRSSKIEHKTYTPNRPLLARWAPGLHAAQQLNKNTHTKPSSQQSTITVNSQQLSPRSSKIEHKTYTPNRPLIILTRWAPGCVRVIRRLYYYINSLYYTQLEN